jgi:putative SOS response-associated peptidase YedK
MFVCWHGRQGCRASRLSWEYEMCGRYTNTVGPEEIGKQIGAQLGVRIGDGVGTRRYNVAPTEQVLTIVAGSERPEPRMLRWDFIPADAMTVKTKRPRINAAIETLRSKGSYYGVKPDAPHRALIVADGFYEWPHIEDKNAKRKLRPAPLHFQLDGGRAFCFAGLWATAPHVEGGPVESATIITCDGRSNRIVGPVHDRMPVILADPELWRAWLDPSVSAEEALTLCKPLPAERMSARAASQAVNSVRSPEGPELLVGAPLVV